MNTLVRLRGYITHSQVLQPVKRLYDAEPKYTLSIQPENPTIYEELEQRIQQIREENIHRMTNTQREDGSYWEDRFESRVLQGSEVCIESLYKPDLKDRLTHYYSDDQFYGQFVQLVGHLYIHQSGIVCLSSHILEPAMHPNDDFEPYTN